MRRAIIATVIIAGIVITMAPFAFSQSTPTPSPTPGSAAEITFKETTHDVGEVWEGEKAEHTFTFSNTGDAVLTITKVKSTCGCTAVILSSKEIEPGGTGEIKATFNTRRYRGKQSKTIYVSSNDPKHPTVQLRLQVMVKSAAHFAPRNLQFGQITRGDEAVRTIKLVPEAGPLEITELVATPALFQVRILEQGDEGEKQSEQKVTQAAEEEKPEKGPGNVARKDKPDLKAGEDAKQPIEIEVSIAADAPVGRHNGTLTAKIDHPRINSLSARLYVRIEGPIGFSPRMLFFNEESQQKRTVKKIRLKNRSENEFTILGVESTAAQFQTTLTTIKPGEEFDVEVQMKPEIDPGRYQGNILIKTDCPDQPQIKIPIRSNVKK